MHYQFTYDCVWVYAKLTGQAGFRCGSALLECVFCASRSGLPFYSEGNLDGFHPVRTALASCRFSILRPSHPSNVLDMGSIIDVIIIGCFTG